jgi:hypothetical protein
VASGIDDLFEESDFVTTPAVADFAASALRRHGHSLRTLVFLGQVHRRCGAVLTSRHFSTLSN